MNKRRNGFTVMARLIGLVKPLAGYMVLAVTMGLIGHLCASFITIFGGYAAAKVLGIDVSFSLAFLFVSVMLLHLSEEFCVMRNRLAIILLLLNCWHLSVKRSF